MKKKGLAPKEEAQPQRYGTGLISVCLCLFWKKCFNNYFNLSVLRFTTCYRGEKNNFWELKWRNDWLYSEKTLHATCIWLFIYFFIASILPRFQSSCAWAPEDMSPVRPNGANNSLSPIVGPTLKAVGKGSRSSQNWREIVSSLPKREVSWQLF